MKGLDYMKNHKEINNLPKGDEVIKLEITESAFLIHHLANYMDDTKKTKIDMDFINYMENIFISQELSQTDIFTMLNRIKFILNSDKGIILYLKALQRYKNILFVNDNINSIIKKITTYPNGKIDISKINSNDIYLLKQLLNLDIPKHQQNEIIDLLSTIIEIL
ncbi:hypothetical protein [Clostridium sp.]|uniref:hypothetical protein n=1 Tax=Clostridium sp. TaxID=1506 RepID=UPI00290C3CD8|nr:hypothetical protein [Clostridium sp.]MDU3411055.1 hypothetical protein [Clostridium sp.]